MLKQSKHYTSLLHAIHKNKFTKPGTLVKLADWTFFPGQTGVIIELEEESDGQHTGNVKILVDSKIKLFHPDDFYTSW